MRNSAGCSPDNGNVHLPAFAWVFVRNSVDTFTFTDTTADDVPATALFDFFSDVSADATDYMFVSIEGAANGGAWCAERADWYVTEYLARAPTGSIVTSGTWNKWARTNAGAWSAATTAGFTNYFGTSCGSLAYDWCSEWGVGGRNFAYLSAHNDGQGESFASAWSQGANWIITVSIGGSRQATCGF